MSEHESKIAQAKNMLNLSEIDDWIGMYLIAQERADKAEAEISNYKKGFKVEGHINVIRSSISCPPEKPL